MERRRRCELRSTRAWSVPNTKLAAFPIRLRRAEFPVRSAPRTRRFVGSHGSREEPKKRQLVIFVFVPFWPTYGGNPPAAGAVSNEMRAAAQVPGWTLMVVQVAVMPMRGGSRGSIPVQSRSASQSSDQAWFIGRKSVN
jgi:hypothetical protein